jgi:hypothetical protein
MDTAMQSTLLQLNEKRPTTGSHLPPRRRVLASAEWVAYFRSNATNHFPGYSASDSQATAAELAAIVPSLRAWQLGETSDGAHLRAAAAAYAKQIGDDHFPSAVELFIREEQRHGEMLGQFLDRIGVGRAQSDWGDTLFRWSRYFLRNIEVWTTPVVMVETLAIVYYTAIRQATGSRELSAICKQILRDEVPHLRFACERLASIHRDRGALALRLTMLAHRLLFVLVAALVWIGHRRALRAGGYNHRRYWRSAWNRMAASWRLMDPALYDW